MNRREFLKAAGISAAAAASHRALGSEACDRPSSNPARLARRPYGKDAVPLSVIGLGGILLAGMPQEQANRIVAEAVEKGVNYFDVAPTYGDAESKLGPALRPYRRHVFLACKTTQRRREEAAAELKRSLERLETDHLDLYQLHGIRDVAGDVDVAFARGGAMEVLIAARKNGQVRHLGFSAHSVEAALAAMDRFDFDSVLFPVNFACDYRHRFSQPVLEAARKKGVTCLALKAMARQVWPADHPDRKRYGKCWYQPLTDPGEVELALRYTLGQPVTAAIPPGEEPLFRLAVEAAMRYRPLEPAQAEQLRALAMNLKPIFPQA